MDETDFKIQEHTPFRLKRHSHKFHAADVRYEIGMAMSKGHIIWAHEPFAYRKWSNLKSFESRMLNCLGLVSLWSRIKDTNI